MRSARRYRSFRRSALVTVLAALVWFAGARRADAQPPIAFVQSNAAVPQSPQSTVTVPFTAAQTAGNLNVVVVGWNDTQAHVSSVTDSKGNAYALAVGPTVAAGFGSQSIFFARNIQAAAAGADLVTVAFDAPANYADVRIAEYQGLDNVNPVDVVAAAQGSSATANSGSVATTNASDLLVGANLVSTFTSGPGTSYTSRRITSPDGDILEDRTVIAVGSYNATATLGSSGSWIMQMVAFRAASGGPADTQAPTAPTNLSASAASGTQINVSWTASTDNVGVTSYLIERCQGSGCTTFAQVGTATGTTFGNTGLASATSYSYRARATDAAGNLSAYSNTASATTPDTQAPTAPTGLAATASSTTTVNVSWTAATDNVGVTAYLIERCQGSGCSSFAQVGTTSGVAFGDAGLTASTTYNYRARATDAAGNIGPYSSTATVTTPAVQDTQAPTAPTNLSATAVSSGQINLSWTPSTDNVGVTGYRVERCQGAGCSTFGQVGTPATASFADGGLSAGTSYSYRVCATDAAGNLSGYSSLASATTPATSVVAFVQANYAAPQMAQTSVNVTYTLAQSAGDLNVVVVGWNRSSGQVLSVADARGNVYTRAVGPTVRAGFATQSIYYAPNIVPASAGANVVTVTFDSAVPFADVRIAEYSGIAGSNPVDVVAAGQGSSATSDSGAAATTTAPDLLVGANIVSSLTTGPGASFSSRVITQPNGDILEDRVVAATGSYNATAAMSSGAWIMQMVAFRAGSSAPDTQAPTVPGGVGATATSSSQITVTWTASTDNVGVAGYRVERCQGAGCTTFAQVGTPATTSFGDTGLTAGTSYSYRVRAADAAGNLSGYSTVASATTQSPDTEPPSAPGTLTATVVSGTQVDLSWGPATDNVGVTGYRVERCQGVGCTVFVKLATPTLTTFSDTGLTPNTPYSYIVRATDAAGNLGPYSNQADVTTGATVPELVAAYAFNEGSGTTVQDLSGNGNNGSLGNAVWTTSGKFGGALSFNGTSAFVAVPDRASLHLTTGVTLEAWVNPSIVNGTWRDVLYKGNDNYYLEGMSTTGSAPAAGLTLSAGPTGNAYGSSPLPQNTWSHLAETFDGTTLRLYVNGVQVGSATVSGSLLTSTNPLEIGGDHLYGQYFQGLIDEVRVYNVPLTPTQIQADMTLPIGTAAPQVSLSQNTADFGPQAVGAMTAPIGVVLSNFGSAPLTIGSIGISGTNAADFGQTNNCGAGLQAGGSCTISVAFAPSTTGSRTATLTIQDNAPGAPHSVALSGTGVNVLVTPAVATLTPGRTQQFAATGGGTTTYIWSVDGLTGGTTASGTISSTGLYTAPSTAGSHTIMAMTSDLSKSGTATVFIVNYAGTFTFHNDNGRTGTNLNETVLTPANVNSTRFGKLQSFTIDGTSHASPLYVPAVTVPGQGVHNVVYVATEHDSVYAFDADGLSATPLWHASFINPAAGVTTVPASDTGECCDIAPEIGITSTPVIDPATGTIYVVAKTKEVSGGSTNYVQRLHALDIATGAEKFGGPVVIQATVPGTGGGSVGGQLTFVSLRENQRPALTLSNGVVYMAFSSHGDIQPYHGWLLGYSASTLHQTLAYCVTANGEGAGLWMSGSGLATDAAGNIYYVSADGTFDANTGGKDYGDSYVKLSPSGTVLDYFTPHNQGTLDVNNIDLGAGGMVLLPDQPGTHPHLMLSAGKNGTIALIDRDNMGHYNASNDNQIVQSLVNIFPFGTPEPGNYSAPVYFNGRVYFSPVADNVQAFTLTNGLLSTSATSRSSEIFAYPGGTLSLSASGASNGILWALEKKGTANGTLRAYDATNLSLELYNSNQAGSRDALDEVAKFSAPLVANGKVYVASTTRFMIFGLLQ